MSDLYYTQEEIDQLQKDIIEKYFNINDRFKKEKEDEYLNRFYNIKLNSDYIYHNKIEDDTKNVIENIKKFKIIGYEEGSYNQFISHEYYHNNTAGKQLCKYVSFINIYGDIFTGIIDKQYMNPGHHNYDHSINNHNIFLKAFSNQVFRRVYENPIQNVITYEPLDKDIEKGSLLPKIILKNIIDNNLIFQLSNKDYNKYKQLQGKFDSESSIDSNCSEKYKSLIDIIMKEKEQQKEIEELKSKLAEQTKLNDDICERMFELKEQLLKN